MKVHFIGIGGEGMSGVAQLANVYSHAVSGSEVADKPVIAQLVKAGITVYRQHCSTNVYGTDLVVRSSGIPYDHLEVLAAQRESISVVKRSECLGMLLDASGRRVILVAGTYGKSTTTAMLGLILTIAKLDPTVVVGAHVPYFGGHLRLGSGEDVVVEACEYDRSFLDLPGQTALVTGVGEDHLDYYRGGLDEIKTAFHQFADRVSRQPDSMLVICTDGDSGAELAAGFLGVVTYGLQSGDWRGELVGNQEGTSRSHFRVSHSGKELGCFTIGVPGPHNVQNAVGTITLSTTMGVQTDDIRQALEQYEGIDCRYTRRSSTPDAVVIEDFGHTPIEMAATFAAVRQEFPKSPLICVSCLRQFHRTQRWLNEFASQLSCADACVVAPIVAGLGDDLLSQRSISEVDLAGAIHRLNHRVVACRHLDEVAEEVMHWLRVIPGERPVVILVIGSGTTGAVVDTLRSKIVPV